mgnify:CR=1 FL=1
MNKITRIKKLKEAMLKDKQDKLVKYEKELNEKAEYNSKLIDTLEMIEPPKDKRGKYDLVFHRQWSSLHDWDKKYATNFYIKDNWAYFVIPSTKEAHDEMHRMQKEDRLKKSDPALVNSMMANMQKHLGGK